MTTTLVNLTEALTKACEDLRKMKRFKGAYIATARCKSADAIRKDFHDDNEGRSPDDEWYKSEEEIERFIRDYALVEFDIHYDELTEGMRSDSEFVNVEFDYWGFEKAFKDWLLPYLGGDESVIPENLRLNHENEFMRN